MNLSDLWQFVRPVIPKKFFISIDVRFKETGYQEAPKMIVKVKRDHKTVDGLFGMLSLDWNPFTAYTVENLAKAIPAGTYDVIFDYSPKFNALMPRIKVPSRDEAAGGNAGIRLHPANYPGQLEGCIAVGDKQEPDAVDNSRTTFNQLFKLLRDAPELKIQVFDIPTEVV